MTKIIKQNRSTTSDNKYIFVFTILVLKFSLKNCSRERKKNLFETFLKETMNVKEETVSDN